MNLQLRTCSLTMLVALALVMNHGCRPAEQSSPETAAKQPIELALNWLPDSQHGGFYAALHFGYFAEADLDVKIIPGGPAAPVVQNVAMKRVTFGVGNADQILMAREQQAPVVAVMAAMQNSPRCIMVRASAPITRFDELQNITLAVGAGKAFAEFLKQRLPLTGVKIVPYTGSIAPFLSDPNFAQQAYVFSEPYVAQQHQIDTRCLMVSDLGFNPYSSCLFTHDDLVRDDPELVRKVVTAVRRGWIAYLERPDEVNRRIHQANPQIDLASLRFGAEAIRELCLPAKMATEQFGTMSSGRWSELARQLTDLELLNTAEHASAAFTDQFLDPLIGVEAGAP